MKIILAAAGTA